HGVPFYVFGHSHAAADRPLPGDDRARVLNTGTWSTTVRGSGAARTFVEVHRGADGVGAAVFRWDGGRMTRLAT
ncbi:MAG TPA: hypothetical protein VN213_05900, partial [Solirubrobacteraceae bacterium]|nr:hypothetical protein [Solirubrobacteraceae bacterium]